MDQRQASREELRAAAEDLAAMTREQQVVNAELLRRAREHDELVTAPEESKEFGRRTDAAARNARKETDDVVGAYQVRPCAFPKSARRTVSSPSVTSTAVIRRRYCIHHIRTVLHKLVTVQTDYPSLLSIHRPIHRPIQYTHTRRRKTDTFLLHADGGGTTKPRIVSWSGRDGDGPTLF